MKGRQLPQSADIVMAPTPGRAHPVLVARRDEPSNCEANDLSNVVPFARPSRHAVAPAIPLPTVQASERPAPLSKRWILPWQGAVIAGSLVLHGLAVSLFWQETPPQASIGIEIISAEMVLGATTAAGIAPTPGEQEVQAAPPAQEIAPEDAVAEQSQVATLMPQEVPVAAQDAAPEVKQEQPQEQQPVEPQERPPETVVAEVAAEMQPVERPPELVEPRPPEVQAVQQAPERTRIAAPTEKKPAEKKQRAAAAPTDAASGIGRGRSDNSANYNGKVAAHLGRYKQYPADARAHGSQGTATVSFAIDGTGRVTAVRLAHGSGIASIDHAVVEMVRRASPFPRPPDGLGRNFTVPVRFNLR